MKIARVIIFIIAILIYNITINYPIKIVTGIVKGIMNVLVGIAKVGEDEIEKIKPHEVSDK